MSWSANALRKSRYSGIGLGVILAASLVPVSLADSNPSLTSTNYFGPDGKETAQALALQTLSITIDIRGGYAETQLEAEFLNPTSNTLEGEFELDMPAGATLIGYGLDINGEMRDGVIVEKKKAERTFNERIREGVDPGLAETTRDNAFRTRVFPIFPEQTRRISARFTAPISNTRDFLLPLASDFEPDRVTIRVTGDVSPENITLPGKLSAEWDEASGQALMISENLPLDGVISITPDPTPVIDLSRHPSGQTFAAFALPPARSDQPFRPNALRIYWDASLSQAQSAGPVQSFLSEVIDDIHPYSVQLIPFSDGIGEIKPVDLRPEGEELEHFTGEVTYDGATNLSGLFAREEGRPSADACFLVTDGRFTLGEFPNGKLPCKLTHIVTASKDADTGVLSLLARQSGGQVINLRELSNDAAVHRLSQTRSIPQALTIDGQDMLGSAEWTDDGDRFRLIAPIDANASQYVLEVGDMTFEGSFNDFSVDTHPGAGTDWAAMKLVSRRAEGASRQALVELSQTYSVVGDETSLLVLETLVDYIDNDIPLPDTGFSEEERRTYANAMDSSARRQAELYAGRLDALRTFWATQQDWYEGDWPKRNPAHQPAQEESLEPSLSTFDTSAPSPPPAPPQSAAPADAPFAESQLQVTAHRVESDAGNMSTANGTDEPSMTSEMSIRKWTPDRVWLEATRGYCGDPLYRIYLSERAEHGDLPSYYLEMADVFEACGDKMQAARIALAALELPAANDDTLTAIAMRLIRYGQPQRAISLLERVTLSDPTRPQPWRDLALAYDRLADRPGHSRADRRALLQTALDNLIHVIQTPWNSAYEGIEAVTLMEANRVLSRLEDSGGDATLPEGLRADMPVDLRIVASWNVDETDMDLWVDEPTGERAMYSNPATSIGGRLSNDMTEGYGPEEYLLRNALPGTYTVYMDYFGSDIINPNGAVAIQAEIWRNWGRPDESVELVDLEFTDDDETEYLVATLTIDGPAPPKE